MIALILGGARSGKSRRALEFSGVTPPNSFFIATAEAMDDEMSLRIQQHLMERGEQWQTIESPIELVNT
ncbi:MAG: adenosylcobinamide kinase/adenosylcobinamide-phosphate guanylyltransferase, partial [Candidatus Azotimanducaceae bacterium]